MLQVAQAERLPLQAQAGVAQPLDALAQQIAAVRAGSLEPTARVRWTGCSDTGALSETVLTPLADGILVPHGASGLRALPVALGEQAMKVCLLLAMLSLACVHSAWRCVASWL